MRDPLRPLQEGFVRERVEVNHRETGKVPDTLKTDCDMHIACSCGAWVSESCDRFTGKQEHKKHQDDIVASLMGKSSE